MNYAHNQLISGLSEQAYHEAPGIRSSALKAAMRSSSHYVAYLEQPRADTPALRLGRLAHLAILEPDVFDRTVRARPASDLRTAKGKAELLAWRAEQPSGLVDVTTDEYATLQGMRDAAYAHPRLRHLLASGSAEQTLFWRDPAHDAPCKARMDWCAQGGIVVDLKTTMDASLDSFGRDVQRYQYGVSAAHYLEGARVSGVANPDVFILVAIEKTPPYGIGLYTLGSDVLDWGHQWRHHAMANITRVMRTNEAPGYPDHFQVLELPKWAPRPIEFADT